MCVCERERESVCVRERERVCVCVRERERGRESVCVCVCKRDTERELVSPIAHSSTSRTSLAQIFLGVVELPSPHSIALPPDPLCHTPSVAPTVAVGYARPIRAQAARGCPYYLSPVIESEGGSTLKRNFSPTE